VQRVRVGHPARVRVHEQPANERAAASPS
jgi:hypothetical protein